MQDTLPPFVLSEVLGKRGLSTEQEDMTQECTRAAKRATMHHNQKRLVNMFSLNSRLFRCDSEER